MFKRNRLESSTPENIETLVGRSTSISGDLTFTGGFHLDGKVIGNVRSDPGVTGVLSVSEHGCIEGSVDVPHVILNGTVRGDIVARERVELGAKARVNGNVYYGVIEMAMGAEISGKLIHEGGDTRAAEANAVESSGT